MKLARVALSLLVMCGSAAAEEPSANTVEEPRTAAPNPGERLVAIARQIPLQATPEAVQQVTAELGEPRISYDWCNRAGCIDSVKEVRATRMTTGWVIQDGDSRRTLLVYFCGGLGDWKVGNVVVYERSTKKGAWGTEPKPVQVFENVDAHFFFRSCWKG